MDATEKVVLYLEGYLVEEISSIVSGERSSRESFEYAKGLKGDESLATVGKNIGLRRTLN